MRFLNDMRIIIVSQVIRYNEENEQLLTVRMVSDIARQGVENIVTIEPVSVVSVMKVHFSGGSRGAPSAP